jgi:hypothetical protein
MSSDLALHHILNLRLIDASAADVKAVTQQLGVDAGPASGEPDIVVRFVPRLETGSAMRHLVMDQAGFTDDAFIVEDGGHKARIFLDQVGTARCEIVCETGASAVPLLVPIVNLTALAKGFMPVHASAFVFQGVGVMASGWPKGGKTSSLFAFLSNGAQFVSDDWLYIDREGMVYPLLQPVKLHDWQLDHLPQFLDRIGRRKIATMRLARAADAFEQTLPAGVRRRFPPAKLYGLMTRYLNKKQRHVYISPGKLLGDGLPTRPMKLRTLFLTLSHESPEIVVDKTTADMALDRLMYSLQYEWLELQEIYVQFRYAFPERRAPLIDGMEQRQRELLAPLLQGVSIYEVRHPHPVPLPQLHDALSRVISR